MNKKIQNIESNYDVAVEDLFNQSVKLEAMEKKAGMADSEVSALRNKLILLQENAEKQEDKLAKSTLELAFACQTADSIVKRRHELENIVSSNEDKIDALEKQVRVDKAPRLSIFFLSCCLYLSNSKHISANSETIK